MDSPLSLLHCKNLSYLNREGQFLLRAIDCCIFSGQRISLTGAAGSGKSLLLRALVGLEEISGEILFRNRSIATLPMTSYRTQVQRVSQQAILAAGTVEDNLKQPFYFSQQQLLSYNRDWAIEELTLFQKNADFLQRDSQTLSGGERQIVNLLRALQLQPVLLLLDEPTSALDSDNVKRLENRIQRWLAENPNQRSYVWISHDKAQSHRIGDYFWTMEHGRITVK